MPASSPTAVPLPGPPPRAAPRTRLSAGRRREQILDAAKEAVGELGFHTISIEAVARRAGITRPIVYGHFTDLTGLLEALVERETSRALVQLHATLPVSLAGGDPRDVLLAALRGYLETVKADPVTWRLVLMPSEGAPAMLRDRISEGRAAVVAQLAAMVGPGLGSGLGSPDPELTARTLSALADEAARLALTDSQSFPVERLLAHAGWLLRRLRF